MTTEIGQADVFISHAHEDKEVARPLAEALRKRGLTVWYDEYVLRLGDSLREVIERGLASARFGVVILSPSFFAKEWPQRELNALLARETTKRSKVLLPVWHNLTLAEVTARTPILADRLAVSTAKGIPFIVEQILEVLEAEKPRTVASVSPPEPPIRKEASPPRERPVPVNTTARTDLKGVRSRIRRPAIAALIAATLIVAGVLLWRSWRSSVAPAPRASNVGPETPAGLPCLAGGKSTMNGIVFVDICPGTFTMGSAQNDPQAGSDEKPAHQVTLNEFWIGKTEITNEQFRHFRSDHQGEANLPATYVSWDDAKAACEHFGGRLPTEAEWEYAARAGSETAWSFGDDEKRLAEYAWYGEGSDEMPHPVSTKKPNAWGLYDMHGNAWEWTADRYGAYPSVAQNNPPGPKTGEYRVLRGGSFFNSPRILRSAGRGWFPPSNWVRSIGLRCARDPRTEPAETVSSPEDDRDHAVGLVNPPEVRASVDFRPGSAMLSDIAKMHLDLVAFRMQQDATLHAQVIGYDAVGSSASAAQRLSMQRAQAVEAYLVTRYSIKASRIAAEGRGTGAADSTGRHVIVILAGR